MPHGFQGNLVLKTSTTPTFVQSFQCPPNLLGVILDSSDPKHFLLHPGEQIHYNVCPSEAVVRYLRGTLPRREFHCVDANFSTEDSKVLRLISPTTIKNGEE